MASSTRTQRRTRNAPAPRNWVRPTLLLVGVLLMLGSAGTWLATFVTDPYRLPLETIRITGELNHVDRAKLQQLVASAIDGGFFSVDMHKLREAAEQLPWIDKVSIRRVWPQTLVMDVTEQVPIGRWGDRSLVNARGEIFSPQGGELPRELPLLRADAADAATLVSFYHSASAQLAQIGVEVAELEAMGRHDWRLVLSNGMQLLLGQAQAARALERFTLALPVMAGPQGRKPLRIDMRYENGFAVQWVPAADAKAESDKRGDA